MKLIIDIPYEMLETIKEGTWSGSHKLELAIRNGEPYEERPQGEWINEYWEDAYQEYYHTCDVCKKEIVKTEYDNYCSCCGAKMRKGEGE